jgi:hypothetical protein
VVSIVHALLCLSVNVDVLLVGSLDVKGEY